MNMETNQGQVDHSDNTHHKPVPEQTGFIDAHCHLADPRMNDLRDALISRAADQGIFGFIQGGVDPEDWDRQLSLSRKSKGRWYLAFGLHPWWVADHNENELEQALKLLPSYLPQAVGLGELGLDFGHRCPKESFPLQLQAFKAQLQLGQDTNKPLILHIVKAHAPTLELLKTRVTSFSGGIVHSFSGTPAQAKAYIDLGFHISIGTGVLRKGFENLKRTVVSVPIESLVIETDAPDQAPAGSEGHINEPANLRMVADAVATIRNTDAITVLNQSRDNLRIIFKI